jgi:hypothetical protein
MTRSHQLLTKWSSLLIIIGLLAGCGGTTHEEPSAQEEKPMKQPSNSSLPEERFIGMDTCISYARRSRVSASGSERSTTA